MYWMNLLRPAKAACVTGFLLFQSDASAQEAPTPDPIAAEQQEPPDLKGTWYLRMRTAMDARVAIIGTTHIKSTTHLLVNIEKRDDTYFQSQKTCIVDTRPSRKLTRTILPEVFIKHLAEKTYPIRVTFSDTGTWEYYADLRQQYVGYRSELAPDGIPKSKKHPAVYDWDEDGKPGASVLVHIPIIGFIEIYIVQTNHTFLNGNIVDENNVEGRTHQRLLLQRTIGAENRLLAASPDLAVAKGHDAFEMVRIEAGSTCADIKRIAGQSF